MGVVVKRRERNGVVDDETWWGEQRGDALGPQGCVKRKQRNRAPRTMVGRCRDHAVVDAKGKLRPYTCHQNLAPGEPPSQSEGTRLGGDNRDWLGSRGNAEKRTKYNDDKRPHDDGDDKDH